MEKLNQIRIQALLGKVAGFIFILIGFLSFLTFSFSGMIFFLIGIIILVTVAEPLNKKYKSIYKATICKEVVEKMFDVQDYQPDNGFSKEFVKNTYLIPYGNTYSSDDYIRGSYQQIQFERSDVCMQNVVSDGKNTTTTTLFKGSWTVLTYPKKITSYLMIREKKFLSDSKPGGLFSNAPATEKVRFEDIDFNQNFDVFAQDQHDAFYVLTPHFIERIKKLEAETEGRMTIGIVDQKVHVLFDTGLNIMEPSLLKPVSEEDYHVVWQEIKIIKDIIDILELSSN